MRSLAILVLFVTVSVHAATLVIVGATAYSSPDAQPIPNAVVVIRDGLIASIGPRKSNPIPAQALVIDCAGRYLCAGFWNCHVHILAPKLLHADEAPAVDLASQLDAMFNRWGFTQVFDLGSSLANTRALQARIESGELRGPRILTVGEPLWTKAPVYVSAFLAQNGIVITPVNTPAEAAKRVTDLANERVNGIKLFTGSVQEGHVDDMPIALVRAACTAAHQQHLLVFAHPQDAGGLDAAIAGPVDVLAHAAPESADWTPEFVARLKQHRIALIPTLTLFDSEGRKAGLSPAALRDWIDHVIGELRAFSSGGGEVLFGTDIGYTEHYNTMLEFEMMHRAGMTFPQILASLTTAPAARFGSKIDTGRIAPGSRADLVVLDVDPSADVAALAKVQMTIREGHIIYSSRGKP